MLFHRYKSCFGQPSLSAAPLSTCITFSQLLYCLLSKQIICTKIFNRTLLSSSLFNIHVLVHMCYTFTVCTVLHSSETPHTYYKIALLSGFVEINLKLYVELNVSNTVYAKLYTNSETTSIFTVNTYKQHSKDSTSLIT